MLQLLGEEFMDDYKVIYETSKKVTVFHSPEWLELSKIYFKGRIYFLYDGRGAMPLLEAGRISKGYFSLPLDTFGGFIGTEGVPLKEIVNVLKGKNFVVSDYFFSISDSGYKEKAVSYILSLEPDYSELFDKYSRSHRKSIRKALREGIDIREGDYIDEFFYLYRELSKTRPIGILKRKFFELVREFMYPKKAKFYIAFWEEEPVSGALILYDRGWAVGYQLGYLIKFGKLGATNLLVDYIVKDLKKSGIREFDLGITPMGALGVHRFKRGFGAEPREFPVYRKYGLRARLASFVFKIWRNLFS